jgi:hypothetical protein
MSQLNGGASLRVVQRRTRIVDVEASPSWGAAIGVDADDGVGVYGIRRCGTFIDARAQRVVVVSRQHRLNTESVKRTLDFQDHVPIECVLWIAVVGGSSAGLAFLGAIPAVWDLPVD